MRPLEAGAHAMLLSACAASLAVTNSIVSGALTGAALLVVGIQRRREGYRWQLKGLYVAAGCQLMVFFAVALQANLHQPTAAPVAIKYTMAALLFALILVRAAACRRRQLWPCARRRLAPFSPPSACCTHVLHLLQPRLLQPASCRRQVATQPQPQHPHLHRRRPPPCACSSLSSACQRPQARTRWRSQTWSSQTHPGRHGRSRGSTTGQRGRRWRQRPCFQAPPLRHACPPALDRCPALWPSGQATGPPAA
jgi:hypothetical protein